MKIGKYIDNVSALQTFQVLRFSTLILIGIILVKSGYSKNEIGIYELFFFLSNVLSFFWMMGLKNALMSYYPSMEAEDQPKLLFNLGLVFFGLALIAGGLLFFFEDYIAYLIDKSQHIEYLGYIILYMVLTAPGSLVEFYYLLKEKNNEIIRYGIVIFSLQLLLVIVGVWNGFEIKDLLLLMVFWAGMKFVWFLVQMIQNGNYSLDFNIQRLFLFFSAPLILHMLLGNGMEYVDGFMVNYFYDEGIFAQFRYGARELPLVTILVGALTTAMIPLAVNDMDTSLATVKKKLSKLMYLLFPISIILILLSPILFPIVYSSEYKISAQIFNIYLLVISSRLLMPQVILFAQHNNIMLMISAFIELIANISLSIFLLKKIGITGIAWGTVGAYLINKLILIAYAYWRHKKHIKEYLNIKLYFSWLLLLVISYYISTLYI